MPDQAMPVVPVTGRHLPPSGTEAVARRSTMNRFGSEGDRQVYLKAMAEVPAHYMIGDVRQCQFEARVELGGSAGGLVGAIVTEDERGIVRVSYFRTVSRLKAAWIDAVHAHSDCCLNVAAAA
jgi:hypothetical protein